MSECIRMPVCKHIVPMHRPCERCGRKGNAPAEKPKPDSDVILRLRKEVNELQMTVNDYVGKTHFNREEADCAIDGLARSLHILQSRVEGLEAALDGVRRIEYDAEKALNLFVKKAHDLKKIDAKRDDVINSLCQKISAVEAAVKQGG